MEIWQAALMGLVQGLTEFLPVSSSGHLVVLQRVFGLEGGLFIPIVLHLGTLAAVCAVFYKDIAALFKPPFKTLGCLAAATIPAGLCGLFLEEPIEKYILNGRYAGIILGIFFIITAALMYLAGVLSKRRNSGVAGRGITLRTAIPMGLAQAVAVLPGVSRSGSTIFAGTLAGGNGEEVAKFSFLMSLPVILGSFALDLAKGLYNGSIAQTFSSGGAFFGIAVAVGFIVSAAVGLIAIKVMLKAVQRSNYKWFSAYLVCAAAVCIILNFCGRLGAV